MAIASVSDLIAALRAYRQLSPEQSEALARERLPGDVRAAARTLVQRGWLTTYQINELFLGRGPQLLLGSYVLVELLGEGGMGQVFKARNWKLGQIVAVKLIRKERLTNPNAIKRFYREIRAAAQLEHPHIVRAFDADEVNGTHFFVMEFVEGIDLNKLVKKQGALDVRRACEYVRQAALGLQHAHERGLVHRDIKPHNLLLVSGGSSAGHQVKVLDMGLARIDAEADQGHSSTMTQEGTVMGTPDYIAPEQGIDAHAVDIRADLYSLGCTLYFLLAGRTPFTGGTFVEKLLKHQQQRATPLGQLRGDVPGVVEALVAKLMAKLPEDRFQTPAELAQALKTVETSSATDITGVTRWAPVPAAAPAQNVFAELGPSDTAALSPALIKPKARPGTRPFPARKIGLLAAAGLAALVVLIVIVRSLFGPTKPSPGPEPVVPQAKVKTALELAAEEEKRRQEEENKRQATEMEFHNKRQAAAEGPLAELTRKAAKEKTTFVQLAKEVREFKAKHGGTSAAIKAAEMLMQLPSPLDELDPGKIPEDAKAHWRAFDFNPPPEVVGVLGEHRGRHWGDGRCMAMSANGKVLASVGQDNVIRLWETTDWSATGSIRGEDERRIEFVALSPDGDLLLEGGQGSGRTPQIWDVHKQRLVRKLESDLLQAVICGAFSADGKRILTGRNEADKGAIQLWNVDTGREIRRLEEKIPVQAIAVAFLPDQKRAVSAKSDGKLRIWSLETGKPVADFEGHSSAVTSVAVSADGKKMLSAAPQDKECHLWLWDIESRKGTKIFLGSLGFVVFSHDEQNAITGNSGDGGIRVHDLRTGNLIRTFGNELHHNRGGMALLPNGKHLVSLTDHGALRLWDISAGLEMPPLTGPVGPFQRVAFSSDCRRLVGCASKSRLHLWQISTAKELPCRPQDANEGGFAAFSPEISKVFLIDRDEFTWGDLLGPDPADRTPIQPLHWPGGVLSWDEKCMAIAGNNMVKAWRNLGGTFKRLPGEMNHIGAIALDLSPDGRRLASGGNDHQVRIWEVSGQEIVQRAVIGEGVGISPNIACLAYAPQGTTLAIGTNDFVLRLWSVDRDSPKEMLALKGHTNYLRGLAFAPNGGSIASAGIDGRVILWHTMTGAKLHEWKFPGPVNGIAFAADSRHLATANGNGTVYILRIPPPPTTLTAEEAKGQQIETAKKLGVPVQMENSIGIKLNLIPTGRFFMGSLEDEPGQQANESPRHTVTISKSFYLGAYEVTVAQFKAFVKGTDYKTEAEKNGKGAWRYEKDKNILDPKCNWVSPGHDQSETHPVVCVSWNDANAFCAWLSKKEKKNYRLPTEAEWEYACRAGTQTPYFFGKNSGLLDKYAWSGQSAAEKSHPVGQLLPNSWGLHDILGNVWEWCLDGGSSYASNSAVDPRAQGNKDQRVVRGASFHPADGPIYYRSAYRFPPLNQNEGFANQGFRIVSEVEIQKR